MIFIVTKNGKVDIKNVTRASGRTIESYREGEQRNNRVTLSDCDARGTYGEIDRVKTVGLYVGRNDGKIRNVSSKQKYS